MSNKKPDYNFSDKFFGKNPFYKRLAKDHLSMFELDSEVISWEVVETRSPKKIPCVYHVHFMFRSITGIDDQDRPIFGNKHTARVTFPPRYPIEPPELYMQTDVWHPNVKSDGKYKGRICGNTKGFGLGFDLFLLVIRIGEILQYKQYHAENTPPFPEDIHAARWVLNFAEPNGLVNKYKDICIDNTPLLKGGEAEGKVAEDVIDQMKNTRIESFSVNMESKPIPEKMSDKDLPKQESKSKPKSKLKISILKKKKAGPKKITIQKKS